MGIFIAIVAFVVFVLIVIIKSSNNSSSSNTSSSTNTKKEVSVELLNEEYSGYAEEWTDYCYFFISGLSHHCSHSDIGGFLGLVAPEPENPYDKNAVAIYRSDAKLIGYVPKSMQQSFGELNQYKPCTCVGYITQDSDGQLSGKVKILKPYNMDFIQSETDSYINWMVNKFGEEYRPKE